MRRTNKKREKVFAVNYKVDPELLNNLDQLTMLANAVAEPLKNSIIEKGYQPVSKIKIRPYSDIVPNSEENLYQVSIKAIFVGKKQAKEDTNNEFEDSI